MAQTKLYQAGSWQETDAHFPLYWEVGGISENPHHGKCVLCPLPQNAGSHVFLSEETDQ